MSIRNRLKEFINHLEIDTAAFEKKVSLSNGFVNNAGNSLREASLEKILNTYPEINRTWLLAGEGTMLKSKKPRLEADALHLASDPQDFDYAGEKFTELPDGTITMRVPIIPFKAYAGYLHGFQDPEYYEDLETLPLNVYKQHRGHYIAFEVRGDSMTSYDPEFAERSVYNGWIAVGRDLQKHHWKSKLHINSDLPWIIVHKTEGILIKDIIEHDVLKGIITIHSLNPDKNRYPDEEIFLDDVEQIFDVVQLIKRKKG